MIKSAEFKNFSSFHWVVFFVSVIVIMISAGNLSGQHVAAGGGLFCSGFGCIVIGIAMLIEKTAKPKVFEDMEIYSRNLPIIVKKLEKIESEIEELKNMQSGKENNNQLT